ncbi:ester cyclase [Nonomuraea sp. NPDC050547]|uniref:ester cyclase n=1 Tax=unclassified Nonomuraea TaxID=2593643 RepID=UPI00379AC1B0
MADTAIFERMYDAVHSRDVEVIARTAGEVVHPQARFHTPVPTDANAVQVITNAWTMLLRAFPDIRVTVEDVVADGDKVVYRNTVTGTHLGEYRGIAPTGNAITYEEIFIIRFADGLIAEIWGVADVHAQLRQLGAIPAIPG